MGGTASCAGWTEARAAAHASWSSGLDESIHGERDSLSEYRRQGSDDVSHMLRVPAYRFHVGASGTFMQIKRLSLLVLATLAGGCSCDSTWPISSTGIYFDSVLGEIPLEEIGEYEFSVGRGAVCLELPDGTPNSSCEPHQGLESSFIMADGEDTMVGISMRGALVDGSAFLATRNGSTVIDSVVDLECIDHKSRCGSYRECTGEVVPDESP